MDDIIEFIFELIFELGFEASKDKKIPKWIRYPLIVLFTLFFGGLFIFLMVLGLGILKTEPLFGSFIILLDLFFIIGSYFKFKKVKRKKKNKKKKK